jgi:two-component system, chemotaxis family, protein-glutamate methylesterase/glutaminase
MNNSQNTPIRVLLVDDSPLALTIISRILSSDPGIEIVGKAESGMRALELIPILKPHLVCTDYFMPEMTGVELTQKIIEKFRLPILIMSGKLDLSEKKNVFSLLEAGALDCIKKPESPDPKSIENRQFISKIHVLSKVIIFIRKHKTEPLEKKIEPIDEGGIKSPAKISKDYQLLAIGASTGGPIAIQTILKKLPRPFSLPILFTQHISSGFTQSFAEWLTDSCNIKVQIVEGEQKMQPGIVYIPAEERHLEVLSNTRIRSSNMPPIDGHRPSINFMFDCVAKQYGKNAIGVILTGMGADGSNGLLNMFQRGALTIAQNEKSCIVFGMPGEAIKNGSVKKILDINEISSSILASINGF